MSLVEAVPADEQSAITGEYTDDLGKVISPLEVDDDASPITDDPQTSSSQRRKKQYAVSVRWEREMQQQRQNGASCTCTVKDCYTYFCCCSRKVGNMFFLCERRDGSPIVVAGPCWPFCIFITVPLIVGLSGLTAYFVIFRESTGMPLWIAYFYLPMIGITLMSLFFVSCRDPGLLERVTDEEAGNGGWFWNEQVGSFRPPGALYCRECKVLIEEYDHLCPWTGTGIGGRNMCCFKIFVMMVNVLCYTSIALVAYVLLKDQI